MSMSQNKWPAAEISRNAFVPFKDGKRFWVNNKPSIDGVPYLLYLNKEAIGPLDHCFFVMDYIQKICFPIVFTCGRVQIHLEVAVTGLK